MREFSDLFADLQAGDETTQIEAKRASDVGKAMLFTITSFSNEPGLGGGYFLLGVAKDGGIYKVVGVPDPDKLQADIAAKCATDFSSSIRPEIATEQVDGKTVVIVRIPEADPNEKPVYLRSVGLPKGACLRIGSTDQHCSLDDVTRLIHLRDETSFDASVVNGATLGDIDPRAIAEYRRTRLNQRAAELKLDDSDLLVAVGGAVQRNGEMAITRAGLILFGSSDALRRLVPSLRIDYVLVSGQTWVPDSVEPSTGVEFREPLLLAIPRIAAKVLQDLPTTYRIKGKNLRRQEIPAIPERVIREAVVNAVMHRNYRAQEPIQIIRFSNRLEIRNPGHSLVSNEELGEPGSKTRNERVAAVLHDCGYAETKGTGIKVMIDQMRDANMTEPIFRSSRQQDAFEVTLLTHHLWDPETLRWLGRFKSLALSEHEAKALVVVREARYIDNATYRRINSVDVLTASTALRRLRDAGLLTSHGKSTATYYAATQLLLQPSDLGHKAGLKPKLRDEDLAANPELVGLLRRIGERTAEPRLIEVAILRLCVTPRSVAELSAFLRRDEHYLSKKFLGRMVREGVLQYRHPEAPNHPKQAYISAPWMAEIEIPSGDSKPKRRKDGHPRLF